MSGQSALAREAHGILTALPPGTGPRQAHAALGDARLFAVHYPREYGGRAGTPADYATVAEAIGAQDFADVVHLVTVQGVGCTILRYGTAEQRARYLPAIASGRTLASLLLSEANAGSDAAAITTSARRTDRGWVLRGEKCWSLHTDWSDFGLCSARTSSGANRYSGITVFLVDLNQQGVTVSPAPRAMGSPYYTVTLDDVGLGEDSVLGAVDGGFEVVTAAAGFERVGFDYLSRGWKWLAAAEAALTATTHLLDDRRRARLARLEYEMRGARALAWTTAETAEGLDFDHLRSAYAKYTCGEAAQAVARWIGEDLLPEPSIRADTELTEVLLTAVREGPELSISGNAVDLLLDTLSLDSQLGEW